MVNKRTIYSAVQVSIKDIRADPTDRITGALPATTLASGLNLTDIGNVGITTSVQGLWPAQGTVRVKTGTGRTEYIRYVGFSPTPLAPALDELVVSARQANGSSSGFHLAGDPVQFAGWEVPLGVQTVSIGTTFNNDSKFHLGQLEEYERIEGIPDIEIQIEKCLDGTKPLWYMLTDVVDFDNLKGQVADYRADIAIQVYPDTGDSATGTPDSTVLGSGMFINSWELSIDAGGDNILETVSLVGNDKSWLGQEGIPSGIFANAAAYDAEVIGSGIQRSENFIKAAPTALPSGIPEFDNVQSVTVSVDFGRTDIFELGSKAPVFRAVDFPVDVTSSFEAITDKGDLIEAIGDGRNNLVNETIVLALNSGFKIDLGTRNKLESTDFSGADAGGGNATTTYEYSNSNSLTISHAAFDVDPFKPNPVN